MMYHVKISSQAETDLRDIYEYIAFELQAPENAVGQIDRLQKTILGLEHMPKRFRSYEKEPWKSRQHGNSDDYPRNVWWARC